MMEIMILMMMHLSSHVLHIAKCFRPLLSLISKYIDTLDDPVARKLEGVLASFRCQMRLEMSHSMKSTHLTDYFHHL
ncbi:hypothetical protein L208DRAFT_1561903 [Tricholoma matsutake]|nr:hypothetical protein L208DRAFT_1561903 [Tricholoma matsutake 945]